MEGAIAAPVLRRSTTVSLRGIESSGTGYRVTISVGGVPKRLSGFETQMEAVAARDQLDSEARLVREMKGMAHKRKRAPPAVCSLERASTLGIRFDSQNEETPTTASGITTKLVRGEMRYSARKWVDGKMRWGGMHATLQDAVAARDALAKKPRANSPLNPTVG